MTEKCQLTTVANLSLMVVKDIIFFFYLTFSGANNWPSWKCQELFSFNLWRFFFQYPFIYLSEQWNLTWADFYMVRSHVLGVSQDLLRYIWPDSLFFYDPSTSDIKSGFLFIRVSNKSVQSQEVFQISARKLWFFHCLGNGERLEDLKHYEWNLWREK